MIIIIAILGFFGILLSAFIIGMAAGTTEEPAAKIIIPSITSFVLGSIVSIGSKVMYTKLPPLIIFIFITFIIFQALVIIFYIIGNIWRLRSNPHSWFLAKTYSRGCTKKITIKREKISDFLKSKKFECDFENIDTQTKFIWIKIDDNA